MTPEEINKALANIQIPVRKFDFDLELPEITPLSHFLSGEAAFEALKRAVDEIAGLAPPDHDVLIHAFDIVVREVRFIEPHTLLFRGVSAQGHETSVIAHFSQLV